MILRRASFYRLGLFSLVATKALAAHAEAGPATATPSASVSPPASEALLAVPGKAGTSDAPEIIPPVSFAKELEGLQSMGVILTGRSDWAAAEIAFRQILTSPHATSENLADALIGLARVYRKQGSFTKAVAIYERYLKDYPSGREVPDVLLELGRTQRGLGAHQLALARFYSVINSTLKLNPESSLHYQSLAKTAQYEIAETHFQQGNFVEANKFFSRLRLLDLAPADRARAHFKSAFALYSGNDYEGAINVLNSYLEQWPGDEHVPEARYLLSVSLRALGRKPEALGATLQLLRAEQAVADPKRWSYWQRRTGNQIANDFFQAGDTLNALAIYQGLAALSPEPAWQLPVTYQIGLCYERMRLYNRARETYQAILDQAKIPTADPSAGAPSSAEPATEINEIARMATWRLGQLSWLEQTEQKLVSLFATSGDPKPPATAVSEETRKMEADMKAKSVLNPGNDHSSHPATAPASL